MSIFKAYDIRGVVPDQLSAEDAYRIGRATARFLAAPEVVFGRDARSSSPALFEALVRGVTDEGVEVVDIGMVATPMLYFAVDRLGAGGGIMLTASHNPAEYNGFKICRENAIPIGEASGLKEIESECLNVRASSDRPAQARGPCALWVAVNRIRRAVGISRRHHRERHDQGVAAEDRADLRAV